MATKLKRIPFDHFVLAAVLKEFEPLIGGKVQDIRRPDLNTLWMEVYNGAPLRFVASCHPEWFRLHLTRERPGKGESQDGFLEVLKSRLLAARLVEVNQWVGERYVTFEFSGSAGPLLLVMELMGKHSNLILVDTDHRVIGAAKQVGKGQSSRMIYPGSRYTLPPVLRENESVTPSPFMRLLGVSGCEPVDPVASRGFGAYPVNVGPLGYSCISCKSVSEAIELTYPEMERQTVLQQLRTSLGAVLDKVLANRNATLAHLAHAISEGSRSSKWQRFGELLLLYRPEVLTESIELPDYDGSSVSIPLDTELSIIENANAYFERAKRAKQSAGTLVRQKLALENEIDDLESAILAVELCGDVRELEQLKLEFQSKRWVQQPNAGSTAKEERPFQGHRIREVLGPGNVQVLYGENAEANDFLTLKVAKPNDFWFHVRGATSAHVVLRTNNQPQKIQPDQLRFAAEIAVRNSSQKHAKYVPVDYTLKKYVRKPKGAARGSATYTLEKTLFVDLP